MIVNPAVKFANKIYSQTAEFEIPIKFTCRRDGILTIDTSVQSHFSQYSLEWAEEYSEAPQPRAGVD